MKIETIVVGEIETNCYLVYDRKTGEALLIDPGAECKRIHKMVNNAGVRVQGIINTHGHGDHIGCNPAFTCPISIHEEDASFLIDPEKNLSAQYGVHFVSPEASRLLKDGEVITCRSIALTVLHTPGHSPGSICLLGDEVLFTGDTLFRDSIGRTDLPYGDNRAIINSIFEKIMPLDDAITIYPGHGPASTIGREKKFNFFLQER